MVAPQKTLTPPNSHAKPEPAKAESSKAEARSLAAKSPERPPEKAPEAKTPVKGSPEKIPPADPKAARVASQKVAALDSALSTIEKAYGKGSIMRLGQQASIEIAGISTGSLS